MVYMGSKARFAKYIIPIITDGRTVERYIEPFAGGMNVIDKISGKRVAADNNRYLIAMWQDLVKGRHFPDEITREFYGEVRNCYRHNDGHFDDAMIGWVGFIGSAKGRFYDGGYGGKSKTKTGVRDYVAEKIRNINIQIPLMKGVEFLCCNYYELEIHKDDFVYCDIPYRNTKQYSTSVGFDHDAFWEWVRELKTPHIFVSEYNAPDDFECIWYKQATSSMRVNSIVTESKVCCERLFTPVRRSRTQPMLNYEVTYETSTS